jgi:hypothetical protein
MRTNRLSLMLIGTVALGCSDATPTGVLEASVPRLDVSAAREMVPLRGTGTLTAIPTAGVVACEAPDGSVIAVFPAVFDVLARYTHLGRTTGSTTTDACRFEPADGTLHLMGQAALAAADGDELLAAVAITIHPDLSFGGEVNVTGGTGRFDGATGWAGGGGTLDLEAGSGKFWIDGTVSSVGQ